MTEHLLMKFMPPVAMLVAASITDLRARRIPNWLTFSFMLSGLLQSFMPFHTVGPAASCLGLASGIALTLFSFAIGALGAGDVKLMGGLGTWLGPGPTLAVFIVNTIIGMVIVLAQAAWNGRLSRLFTNTAVLAINMAHLRELGLEHATATGKSCRSIDRPLPYAVPVLIATLLILARN